MNKWFALIFLLAFATVGAWLACQSSSPEDSGVYQGIPAGAGGGGDDDDDITGDDDSGETDDDDDSGSKGSVLIIYRNDNGNPAAMQNVLGEENIDADMAQDDQVRNVNLSQYDALIVDSTAQWTNVLDVNAVEASSLPILGFYYGGGVLFDELDLPYGYFEAVDFNKETHCWTGHEEHAFFTTPYKIIVDEHGQIRLYENAVYLRTTSTISPPEAVFFAALAAGETERTALTFMREKYFYWAFSGTLSDMSDDGVRLFINVVAYLIDNVE